MLKVNEKLFSPHTAQYICAGDGLLGDKSLKAVDGYGSV